MQTAAAIELLEQSVQTFRADSMQEALIRVRRELGPDALIVHTRQIEQPPRFPWQKAKTVTEILAANLPDAPPPSLSSRPHSLEQGPAEGQRFKTNSQLEDNFDRKTSPQFPPQDDDVSLEFSSQARTVLQKSTPVKSPPTQKTPLLPLPEIESRSEGTSAKTNSLTKTSNLVSRTPDHLLPTPPDTNSHKQLEERLITLERMIAHLTKQLQQQDWTELTPEWSPLYDQLTSVEVEAKLARDLIHELRQSAQKLPMGTLEQKQLALRGLISAKLNCKPGLKLTPGKRTIAALIGPTGVGKTTTLAKLAASFTFRQGLKIGLITIDTYRIAAVDQLRTYAEIINIPMQVVSSQHELQEALKKYAHYDLVLIDTAGRSPHDELKVKELQALLNSVQVTETFLVMSAVSSLTHLEHTLKTFSPIGATSLILTKLDEHSHKGQLLNLLQKTNLPLSYITTGQDVPHDISPADPSHLTSFLF
jgi:flagellar biosynthesis protein FlhF